MRIGRMAPVTRGRWWTVDSRRALCGSAHRRGSTSGVRGVRARLARPSSARRRPLVLARCAHAGSDALAAARRRRMATISYI